MAIKYLLPRYGNALEDATTVTTVGTDTLFPTSHFFDRYPSVCCKLSSAAANGYIRVNVNKLENYDFEDWALTSLPDGWSDNSSGTGSIQASCSVKNLGSKALKLTAGTSGGASVYQDATVLSGSNVLVAASLQGDGTNDVKVFVRNLETGSYLTTSATWSTSTVKAFHSRSSGSFGANSQSVAIESYTTTYNNVCTLRMTLRSTVGVGIADTVKILPKINFCSVHGHNIKPGRIACKLRAANTTSVTSGYDMDITMGVKPGAFFHKSTTLADEPFWRIDFIGTPSEPIKIGEVVLGEIQTLSTDIRPTYARRPITYDFGTIESRNAAGNIQRSKLADIRRRTRDLRFTYRSCSAYNDVRELYERSDGGNDPVVFIADDTKTEVMYGHMNSVFSVEEMPNGTHYSWDLSFEELPFDLEIE